MTAVPPDDQIDLDLGDVPPADPTRNWYAMQRGWMEHPIFRKERYTRREAWCWLIEHACWRETPFNNNGVAFVLARGELCTSLRDLAKAWRWSKSGVERFISCLKHAAMIGTRTGTGRMVIKVVNYSRFQPTPSSVTGTPTGTPTGTAPGQERDIKEEGKKERTTTKEPTYTPPGGDAAVDSRNDKGRQYAFEGNLIRLTQTDFDRWQESYHAIPDLRAELQSLDDFYHQELAGDARKKWYHRASTVLGKKHQSYLAEQQQRREESRNPLWDQI